MPRIYSDTPASVKPCKLKQKELAYIGRVIRAVAEIEDLIGLFILRLSRMGESAAVVLLGRTQLSRKLEMARYLSAVDGPVAAKLYKDHFASDGFQDLIDCRNAVAHGILIGVTTDKRYCFLTAKTSPPDPSSAYQLVLSYRSQDLQEHARYAEEMVPAIEDNLQLRPWREQRLGRPLLGRAPGQTQPSKKPKPPRPPRSSRP